MTLGWIFLLMVWGTKSTAVDVVGPFPTEEACWAVHNTVVRLMDAESWWERSNFKATPCVPVMP